jgi:excisionase family DNA binding protein
MPESNKPIAYSIKQACELSSLGKTTIYRIAQLGKLRLIRVGGRTVVSADSLHALLEGREQSQ